ncbi:MAG TPA: 2OG-Fe(II) oxygenase [Caulobacterales bacterium]|nr:2OG-Fe(II) oxygenase [Caulobacterales bacterium]
MKVQRKSVDGRDVAVFDDLMALEEAKSYFNALTQASFTRTEVAKRELGEFRHWVCETPLENLPRLSLWPLTQQAVAHVRPSESYQPYRAYTNHASFGDMLFTHFDALPGARELTALWYLCDLWDVEWGGETLFFDAEGDAQAVVSPKPGRLVLFDGAIRHVGRAPNRICTTPRYTFAIKLRLSAR